MAASSGSTECRNVANNAVAALLNTGYVRIYSGTRPANGQAALSGNTLLAELRFGATAFGASASGVATANAITQTGTNNASGTATFARLFKSDGTSQIRDMDVVVSATPDAVVASNTTVVAGGTFGISALTMTQAA